MKRFTCACGSTVLQRGGSVGTKCAPCLELPASIRARGHGKAEAAKAVSTAIRSGALPPASDCTCVDCGAAAWLYEHRDYNRPLDVEPVCRSCNWQRGPAIPLHGSFERWMSVGLAPIKSRRFAMSLFSRLGIADQVGPLPGTLKHSDWVRLMPIVHAAIAA